METDEAQRVLPFQLQFDKPVASQDLLAMVTEDSKILLHRFILAEALANLSRVCFHRSTGLNYWTLHQLKESVVHLEMENEKVRSIPHSVVAPLAVSSSRGVACVFAARKRVLVYFLDEDEDEVSDAG